MSLKFIVHGVEVTATDAEEAARLIRELGKQNAAAPQLPHQRVPARSRPKIKAIPQKKPRRKAFHVTHATVSFLNAIKEAGRSGTLVAGIMEALQADHPKGVGARLGKVNAYIGELGFPPEQVYQNPRTAEGRLWTPGSKLDAALDAAKKALRG